MSESEYGNVSWVYFVISAYVIVGLSIAFLLWNSLARFRKAQTALKEEGFSDDK